jgi:hypothetical protein
LLSIRYIPSYEIKKIDWAGHVACWGRGEGAYRGFVLRPEGRRPLGIPRRGWVDNIKCIFKKWDGDLYWIDLANDTDR